MAELTGGTTIGGHPAIHTGMQEVVLDGNIVVNQMGIGTSTPSEALDVSGNVKVSGSLIVGGINISEALAANTEATAQSVDTILDL